MIENQNADVRYPIETVSGRSVDILHPSKSDIDINDIAWALSRISRFAGHTVTEIPYNVAQHSVYVAQLAESLVKWIAAGMYGDTWEGMSVPGSFVAVSLLLKNHDLIKNPKRLILGALLHDGHEAYIGDLPSPIKRIPELKSVYSLIESRLDTAIDEKCGFEPLPDLGREFVKFCDKTAQAIESYQFMPSRGLDWNLPRPSLKQLQTFPQPKPSMQSYSEFLEYIQYVDESY